MISTTATLAPVRHFAPSTRRMSADDYNALPLYAKLQADNAAAWAEFTEVYGKLAFGAARRSGLQPADCDDAAQETLFRVYKGIHHYSPEKGEFDKWFSQVARSAILNIRYTNSRKCPTAEADPVTGETALDYAVARSSDDSAHSVTVLAEALADVERYSSPRTFTAFEFQWVQGKTAADTGEILKMSEAAALMAKSRVLSALRSAVLARAE